MDEDITIKSPVKKKLVPKRERKNVIIFNNSDLEDIFELAKERDRQKHEGAFSKG